MNGYYGFYSSKADEFHGHSIYLNENNEEIKVTYVTKDPLVGYFQYAWKDKEFVGPVIKHIRRKRGNRGWRPPWLAAKSYVAQIFNEME